jgi:PhnB protein
MARAKKPVPDEYHTITPSLTLDNAAQAIDWYTRALGAKEIERIAGPDGKIMHAELQIGSSRLMVNDPMMGYQGPLAMGGSPAAFYVYVEDCDAVFNRAVGEGAKVLPGMGQLADQFWGDRSGSFTDPFGYRWTIATRKEDLTREEIDQRMAVWMKQFTEQAKSAHQ